MNALTQLQKETEQKRKEIMKKQNLMAIDKSQGSNSSENRQEIKLGKSSLHKK